MSNLYIEYSLRCLYSTYITIAIFTFTINTARCNYSMDLISCL